jgi:hypothetical protein
VNATDYLWTCDTPSASPVLSVLFFVSYTLVGSLAMLPMFIGTISLSMSECITELNKAMAERKLKQNAIIIAKKIRKLKKKQEKGQAPESAPEDHDPEAHMSVKDINRSRKLKSVLLT